MRHLIIASHGTLADSLIETAQVVCGAELVKDLKTFLMKSDTNPDDFVKVAEEYIQEDPNGEYFVMTDLYGASPCVSMVKVLRFVEYRLVTGVNLGMLLEVLLNKDLPLIELEEKAIHAGKEGVGSFYIKA